jgi:ubiquinone/menaquinone biosynthesis C-methylase UbiE
MNHADHVDLLRSGVSAPGGIWADFGAGSGAFTLALADLLGPEAIIVAIDRDRGALRRLESAMRAQFPKVGLEVRVADFSQRLELPPLAGVVMANSLHFYQDKLPIIRLVYDYLHPDGRLLLVEYGTDRGNSWVPYPLSFSTWEELARQAGFRQTSLLATRPSRFLKQIYSAASLKVPRIAGPADPVNRSV